LVDLAAVYSREIDNKTLTLVASGWTYNHTFVLFDKETGTLWYPYTEGLMGIQGKYFKKWLKTVPAMDTTWEKWHKKHPDTKLLR
jgi:hypothetical protein